MVGYKAAWSQTEAETSWGGRGMYEAAINIDWLTAFCNSAYAQTLAGDVHTYEDLLTIVATQFALDPTVLASSRGGAVPKEHQKNWSFTLAAYAVKKEH